MKNKIREKIVASVMLSAFVITSSVPASFAMSEYYGYIDGKPAIRAAAETAEVSLRVSDSIPNGDSVVNLSLRDADIKQVLRMFADQAGMNIIFTPEVEGTVTMDLVDIPLKDALKLVVKTNKLFYDIQANTFVISTAEASLSLTERHKGITIVPVKYVNAAALAHFMRLCDLCVEDNRINYLKHRYGK
jgi:type II secretory pathway component GspD/PulD (secretin)